MAKLRAIVADMDGTLIDSMYLVRRGLYEAVRAYLTDHLETPRPVVSYDEYVRHVHGVVGKSTREMLKQTVREMYADTPEHLEGIDFEALSRLVDPIQDELAPEYVRAFDGAEELLRWIGTQSLALAIFTGATPYQLVRNLGAAFADLGCRNLFRQAGLSDTERLAELAKAFERAYGIGNLQFVTALDIQYSKPHPEGAILALERLNVAADEAIMLGDHVADIGSGRQAGIPLGIGVMAADGDSASLLAAGAEVVVSNLAEVPGLLAARGLL